MADKQLKDAIRNELIRKRNVIPPEVRNAKNRIIQERLYALDEFMNARVVFSFVSFRTEVDTSGIIKKAFFDRKKVVVPKVNKEDRMLLLYEIKNMDELSEGYMGIPEPSVATADRSCSIHDAEIVIIPGVGFDPHGNRIGYGAGYYDKLLSEMKRVVPVIAPAYEEQLVDFIPAEEHDIRVDLIVTDRRVIRCA